MSGTLTGNIWYMIKMSSIFPKLVLVILLILSAYSWAIMLKKFFRFRRLRRQSKRILSFLSEKSGVDMLRVRIKVSDHPIARVLDVIRNDIVGDSSARPDPFIFQERLSAAQTEILENEERYVSTLSTIVTVSPFLGLLGTIWGITESFWAIGQMSSANIAVVAPGLAEALITTLAGLIVAIPAALGFDYCQSQLKRLDSELESFSRIAMSRILKEMGK